MTRADWRAIPESVPFPAEQEVHLWRVNLSGEKERRWRGILTTDEQERANRFHFTADRRQFTVTRALLRTILGQYLDMKPKTLRFEHTEFGKPSIDPSQNPRGIRFNIAHSGDCSLLAFGLATSLGVDVEDLQIGRNVLDLARFVFSPSQYERFLALPEAERTLAFFESWTRKEAIVKALGGGLSIPLDSLEVEDAGAPEWFVCNINVGVRYAAAIAARARHVKLRLWNWSSAGEMSSTQA
jgi:4'-phosphopantetheinyl transferase